MSDVIRAEGRDTTYETALELHEAIMHSAQAAALELGHGYVGCEHLLLAMLREEEDAPGRALRASGVEEEKMRALMAQLRREPLQEIAGTKVVRMRDYQDGSVYVMGLGRMDKTPISGSNVLYFELDDGCSFIVRPSGTEPKIKVYILGVGATRPECDERVQRYAQFAETLRG